MALSSVLKKCLSNSWHGTRNVFEHFGAASLIARRWGSSLPTEEKLNTEPSNEVSTNFVNRNPRNLELLGLAWKRRGWKFQYPNKEFYHRIVLTPSHRHAEAYLEHYEGSIIITCSTKEAAIRKHLYKSSDLSAFYNIGKVLAQRCIESGIENVSLLEWENSEESEKFQMFKKALNEGGLNLTEPQEAEAPYVPGIDYDNKEKVQELLLRQHKVWNLGKRSLVAKWRKDKLRWKGRRRPILMPRPLEMPSYTFYS